MSNEGIDSTAETQSDAAFGISKRPQRARKTTKFYSPASSAPKRQKKIVGRTKNRKKTTRNEKSIISGGKRKAIDVPVEQSKKRKVAEPAGSKRKLDIESGEDETEEPRKKRLPVSKKADLIKVRPVPGKKHVQQGRCFSTRYIDFEKCTACRNCEVSLILLFPSIYLIFNNHLGSAKKSDICRFIGIRVFGQKKGGELVYGPDFMSVVGFESTSTYEAGVSEDEVKNVRVLGE
jgi:hypothetical protein